MAETEWILLNPGPANTTTTVRRALVMPDLCHREPEFFRIMRSCRERLVRLSGGTADWTAVLFTGSGTAAAEAALASAVPPDGGVLVLNNGVYGDRMVRICRAHNIRHHAISCDNVTPVAPADVARVLRTEGVANRVAPYAEACRALRDGMAELGFQILVPEGARSNILTTFRLPVGVTYDALHDAMKRRGYIIYAGQGDIRTYAFRVSNMGTLTPLDMKAVVDAFAASLDEIGVAVAPRRG